MQQQQQQQLQHQKQQKVWHDGLAEVKETFRRVALVKHTGFSVWNEPRSAPNLERVLRWNRQARNLSQVPHSLRARVPSSVLREISNNRSTSVYVQQTHLQNVSGMCNRIRSHKSLSERRKDPFDTSMHPVFVRRTAALPTQEQQQQLHLRPHSVPLFYTPQPFKFLYDISNNAPPFKRPRSSEGKAYDKLFIRPSSAMSSAKKLLSMQQQQQQQRRVSSAPGQQRWWRRSPLERPPSNSRRLKSEEGYFCHSSSSDNGSGSLSGDGNSTPPQQQLELELEQQQQEQQLQDQNRVSIPKLRLQSPCCEEEEPMLNRNRDRVVTFASPVEKAFEELPPLVEVQVTVGEPALLQVEEAIRGGEGVQDRQEEVMIKHSSDPYCDFRDSMMSMIQSEGLSYDDHELEELFQYYMDLNPRMHHPVLERVIRDIKSQLLLNKRGDR